MSLLLGCTSPIGQFQSKKDLGQLSKLERVLIVYHHEEESVPTLGRKYSDALLTRLTELLVQRSVVVAIVRPRNDELDENAPIQAAATRFHPRQLLHFGLKKWSSRTGWSRTEGMAHDVSVTFSFSLSDVERARVVWRGEVHYDALPDAQSVAEQLVQRLVADGFLSGFQQDNPFASLLAQTHHSVLAEQKIVKGEHR